VAGAKVRPVGFRKAAARTPRIIMLDEEPADEAQIHAARMCLVDKDLPEAVRLFFCRQWWAVVNWLGILVITVNFVR